MHKKHKFERFNYRHNYSVIINDLVVALQLLLFPDHN